MTRLQGPAIRHAIVYGLRKNSTATNNSSYGFDFSAFMTAYPEMDRHEYASHLARKKSCSLVMTTDFLVNALRNGKNQLEACAMKPAGQLENPRAIEKLEVEGRYWTEKDVPWRVFTDADAPGMPSPEPVHI